MPVIIITNEMIGNIVKIIVRWNVDWVTIITPINIINVMKKLINSEIIPPSTKMCFGAGVLVNIFLFPLRDIMAILVPAVKKSKIHFPDKRYTG